MKISQRLETALGLVEDARSLSETSPDAGNGRALHDAFDQLRGELEHLLSSCHATEIRIAILEIIADSKEPEQALVASLRLLTECLSIDASGLRLIEGEDFPYFTTTGFSDEFVMSENSLCRCNHDGEPVRDEIGHPVLECMCGNVVQGRFDPSQPFFTTFGSFWTNSTSELLAATTEKERMGRTRDRCRGEGYESVALIPLHAGDETFGLLQFNDHQKGKFTAETIALLEDLSGYLARLLV